MLVMTPSFNARMRDHGEYRQYCGVLLLFYLGHRPIETIV